MPTLTSLLLSLLIVLVIDRFLKKFILSLLVGIFLLGIFLQYSPSQIFQIVLSSLGEKDLWFLLIAIYFLLIFSHVIQKSGFMGYVVQKLQTRFSNRIVMAMGPAIVGFIPMPGGALFSAPLVERCAGSHETEADLKTRINYWFRHIWEYWLPLYPGIFLSLEITQLGIFQLIMIGAPLSLITFVVGYLTLLRKVRPIPPMKSSSAKDDSPSLLYCFSPLLLLFTLFLSLGFFFPWLKSYSPYAPILLAILPAIAWTLYLRPITERESWKKILVNRQMFEMLILILVINLYTGFIQGTLPSGVPVMQEIQLEMQRVGLSPLFLVMLLPLISGLTTGIAIGYIGTSFPIIFSLISQQTSPALFYSTVALAYVWGQSGQMLSPIHTCNVVTNRYFNSKLVKTTFKLCIPAFFTLVVGSLYAWGIYYFFPR